uniref:Thioredoxin-like fold domain-containing protein n=1 Tax=Setaria digitata TaxID=48799 RepID=A0A915Q6B8_9BILA
MGEMLIDSLRNQAYEFYEQLTPWGKVATAGGIAVVLYIPYRYLTGQRRKTPIKDDYTKGMVYLYQFPRMKYIPNISPFCLKLETWLRMADIQYENVCSWRTRSLEGTLPFLEHNGKEYPDSALAIRDMTRIFSKESMESHLSDEQKATYRAFEAMAENSLVMTVGYVLQMEHLDEVFQQISDDTFGILAPLWKFLLKMIISSKMAKKLKVVALGKHSREEVINIGMDDLKAISSHLGNRHYFAGFKPTKVDIGQIGMSVQRSSKRLPTGRGRLAVENPYGLIMKDRAQGRINLRTIDVRLCDQLRQPGVEPGSAPWEGAMIPLHHWRAQNNYLNQNFTVVYFGDIKLVFLMRLWLCSYGIRVFVLLVHLQICK